MLVRVAVKLEPIPGKTGKNTHTKGTAQMIYFPRTVTPKVLKIVGLKQILVRNTG